MCCLQNKNKRTKPKTITCRPRVGKTGAPCSAAIKRQKIRKRKTGAKCKKKKKKFENDRVASGSFPDSSGRSTVPEAATAGVKLRNDSEASRKEKENEKRLRKLCFFLSSSF
jgi:hypothetical protein